MATLQDLTLSTTPSADWQVYVINADGSAEFRTTLASIVISALGLATGENGRVLFNDNGTIGDDAGITYVKATDTLNVAGSITQAGTAVSLVGHVHSAADITSGTLPDGRFPATLPAASGTNLTSLNATNLSSGTVPDGRFPATLPAASGANLTALNATNLDTGTVPDGRFPATLPAASGVNLTALNATNLGSGTVPDGRFPATLPAASGVNLTALNATNLGSGTIPDARFPSTLPALSGANLTNLDAGDLATGTVPLGRLSGITDTEISNSAAIAYSKLNLTGAILSADLAGSIAISKLSITGTPNGSKFLRDDGSWQTVSGGAASPLILTASGASEIPLIVKGAASQSANLFEAQNSAGTVLSAFNASGSLGVGTGSPGAKLHAQGAAFLGTGSPTAFLNGTNHTVEIAATSSATPLTLVGGSGTLEQWKDTTPSVASMIGLGTNGAISDNWHLSTYNPSTNWVVRMTVLNSNGNVGLGTTAPVGRLQVQVDNIGTTSTHGIILENATAATVGAQQYSPRTVWTGQGWKTDATAASQLVSFAMEVRPVQGTANPTGALHFLSDVNSAGYTNRMHLTSDGNLLIGATTAATARLTVHNTSTVAGRAITALADITAASNAIGSQALYAEVNLKGTVNYSGNTQAVDINAQALTSGTVANIHSINAYSYNSAASTVTLLNGCQIYVQTDAGTATTAQGYFAQLDVNSTATVTTWYGYRVGTLGKAGGATITTAYHFYVASQTVGTTRWGFYSVNTASFFGGGATAQATSAGSIPLIAKGASSQSANLQEWQTDGGTPVASLSPAGNLFVGGILSAGSGPTTITDAAGKVLIAALDITGTPTGTKFLRDDGSWATPGGVGGGSVTSVSVATAAGISGSVDDPNGDAEITIIIGSGAITNTQLAGSIAYSKLSLTGAILNADLAGSIALSKLSITGTPDGTKFLRDDGSWQAAGGAITGSDTHVTFFDGANTPAGDAGLTYNKTSNVLTALGGYIATLDSLGTTSTTGLLLQNTTAATDGAQQYSPRTVWSGRGWKTDSTAASQSVSFSAEVRPVQGAASPTGVLHFLSDVNGGGYTSRATIDTAGQLAASSMVASWYYAAHTGGFVASGGGQVVNYGGPGVQSYVNIYGGWGSMRLNLTTDGMSYNSLFGVGLDGGTSLGSQFSVSCTGASTVGQIIRGFASQSANLQEWQTVTPTTVAYISAAGNFHASGVISAGTGPTTLTSSAGKLLIAAIDASGTPSGTTYLRGDGSWSTPSGGTISGADTRVLFFDGTDNPAGDAGLTYNKTTDTLTAAVFAGSGASLTALNATNLGSGTIPDARFPATLPAMSGVNLTALNGTNISSGTVAVARLGSGSPSASNFLRGDGAWSTPGSAAIVLSENIGIALNPAGSADGKWSGITITGTAGYTQAFGDLVYLDPTDSRWEATDANSAAAADGDARGILGMVVVAGTDGTACTLLLHGVIRADAKFPSFTINNPIYVSETAGLVTQTQPTTTDAVIRIIGQAVTADELYFDPDNIWITRV